jgi:hypothetical protein
VPVLGLDRGEVRVSAHLTQAVTRVPGGYALDVAGADLPVFDRAERHPDLVDDVAIRVVPGVSWSRVDASNGTVTRDETGFDVHSDGDTTVAWRTATDALQAAYFVQDGHGLVVVEPPVGARMESFWATPVGREVLFVIDERDTMAGAPMEAAKATMRQVLLDLGDADSFGILSRRNAIRSAVDWAVPADTRSVAIALAFVRTLRPLGWTDLSQRVVEALELTPDPTRQRLVVVLTDGADTMYQHDLEPIEAALGDAQLLVVATSQPKHRVHLDALARAGRGALVVVEDGDVDALVARVRRRLHRLQATRLAPRWAGSVVLADPGVHTLFETAPASWSVRGDVDGTVVLDGDHDGLPLGLELAPIAVPGASLVAHWGQRRRDEHAALPWHYPGLDVDSLVGQYGLPSRAFRWSIRRGDSITTYPLPPFRSLQPSGRVHCHFVHDIVGFPEDEWILRRYPPADTSYMAPESPLTPTRSPSRRQDPPARPGMPR